MKNSTTHRAPAALAAAAVAIALAACGGGGNNSSGTSTPTTGTSSSTAMSSGTISAFGSVFVNGHEFDTRNARIVDDDTGEASTDMRLLEVGMSVDVKNALSSTAQKPVADEIHIHPLVRGIVDASDTGAGSLLVLGQSVQLTAATNFSDHRACLTATTSPCTAVAGQSDLIAATGSGSSAVAGSYVTVYGYLYSTSATSGTADIVATLVSVNDAPSSTTTGVNYKVEGLVNAVGTNNVTIGGLLVDLSNASCYASASKATCASAFSVGQVVSAFGSAAPSLPATTLAASVARQRTKLAVETTGADIEIEGKVSSVTTSPAALVIRGVAIDASAITGTLPAVGDEVRVVGTVASGGTSVAASSITVLQAAASATYGLEGNVESVAAGTSADSFVVTLLGQSVKVNAATRLADRSSRASGGAGGSGTNPFNITTFQTYLAASTSQHVLVRTQADASGNLTALSLTIVAASTDAAIGGVIDASPAPVNSTSSGTPTTFSVHGLAVSADPSSVVVQRRTGHGMTTSANAISAGDLVLARGTYASGTLTIAARIMGAHGPASLDNIVIDAGAPIGRDHDSF